MSAPIRRRSVRLVLAASALAALALAAPAAAHGPTVRLGWDGPRPPTLAVGAGETVHFHNASTTARTFTLVADDGSFESPPLARGEGWHHTFERDGRFGYHYREHPDRTGEILVAPAP